MPFHIFRLFFPISPQKSCMTNAMQQGKPFQYVTIAVGRLQSYPPGLPAGRGVLGSAENIPYMSKRPGGQLC